MITYVDTSMFVKLFVEEPGTARAATIWDEASEVASVVLIKVEGRSALAAARRGRRLSSGGYTKANQAFDTFVNQMTLVGVTELLVERASELAEAFALRGYDAVHLAAAERVSASLVTSADRSLCAAAGSLGFHVANPMDA